MGPPTPNASPRLALRRARASERAGSLERLALRQVPAPPLPLAPGLLCRPGQPGIRPAPVQRVPPGAVPAARIGAGDGGGAAAALGCGGPACTWRPAAPPGGRQAETAALPRYCCFVATHLTSTILGSGAPANLRITTSCGGGEGGEGGLGGWVQGGWQRSSEHSGGAGQPRTQAASFCPRAETRQSARPHPRTAASGSHHTFHSAAGVALPRASAPPITTRRRTAAGAHRVSGHRVGGARAGVSSA